MKKHWILLTAVALLLIGAVVVATHGNEISIGNFHFDYFSSGPYAIGVFAAGNFSIGIFSAGIFSVGFFGERVQNCRSERQLAGTPIGAETYRY